MISEVALEVRSGAASPHRVTAAVLLIVSIAVLIMALAGGASTVRTLLVVAFAVTAPGWAVVAFWRPASAAMEWTLATALSVAIMIVLATSMVVLSAWSPVPVFAGLAVVTAAVLIRHLMPARASRATA